ncbi:MAG: CRISPR-associated helicase Cas3' [Bacteroidetes bacterium]|nr:CRISPR-associated helicase Cas3' [Bacteroidota bacterium]
MDSSYAWGKFNDETFDFHRLEYHCADVAACFLELLADPVLQKRVAVACRMERLDPVTRTRFAYIAYLHDFGKVNAGFQFKVNRQPPIQVRKPRKAGHIAEALYCIHHRQMCEALNLSVLEGWGPGVIPLFFATLAHHGRPANPPNLAGSGPPELWKPADNYDPVSAARTLVERGQQWFAEAFENDGPPLPENAEFAHLFCGLVTLADQIGSDPACFPLKSSIDPDYWATARSRAADAVRKKGFARRFWRTAESSVDVSVQSLFGYDSPRSAQQVVQDAPLDSKLLILESETGSGKTEAAILRFAALWEAGIVDGLYFALPTRAAAKQLHRRVSEALERLLPDHANVENVLAIPGYLKAGEHSGQYAAVDKFTVYWEDHPDDENRLARWAAESPRKFLSAPAAVGTIDQVLLAGLKVKWSHLRSASVARSLLVIDEVHASSSYMATLLRNVLHAHLDIGGHALIMSATLGATARNKFLHKSTRVASFDFNEANSYPYPVLTLSRDTAKPPECLAINSCTASKSVAVDTIEHLENPSAIAEIAAEAAQAGARVLVIRNTVSGAQSVFDALLSNGYQDLILRESGQPTLHHSRFSVEDRKLLDHAVERELGKNSSRAGGKIIIGTQTLEQSLDIDADILISDLCPADVLLQRIGRLHRHPRNDRPSLYCDPECLVLVPESGLEIGLKGGLLKYGMGTSPSGGVYENVVGLESTRRAIEEFSPWIVPSMCRNLVERATHQEFLRQLARDLGPKWTDHLNDVTGRSSAGSQIARLHALTRTETFDENFTFGGWESETYLRTRLGDDGFRVKLISRSPGPFKKNVTTFNLPAHLFRSSDRIELSKDTLESATLESITDSDFLLTVGDFQFNYGCRGIGRQNS